MWTIFETSAHALPGLGVTDNIGFVFPDGWQLRVQGEIAEAVPVDCQRLDHCNQNAKAWPR